MRKIKTLIMTSAFLLASLMIAQGAMAASPSFDERVEGILYLNGSPNTDGSYTVFYADGRYAGKAVLDLASKTFTFNLLDGTINCPLGNVPETPLTDGRFLEDIVAPCTGTGRWHKVMSCVCHCIVSPNGEIVYCPCVFLNS
jgi:hypothetical protein